MEETEITIFKEWKAACLSTFCCVTARQAFDLNPDPITSCLSTEAPDFQCQWDHIDLMKQMISIDHPLPTITASYYFSHILHVPTGAARHCIYALE